MATNSLASNEPTCEDILNEEFLLIEKSCESKDSDDEIRNILNELKRLSTIKNKDIEIGEDTEDVDIILKRAEDIALETKNLLNSSPVVGIANSILSSPADKVPQIKVTKQPTNENNIETDQNMTGHQKVNETIKVNTKENIENRRKTKTRPLSAGFIDCKKKEVCKVKTNNSPKRSLCKHENVIEELKDTNERVNSLELLNVQLTEDNKLLKKKLDQINNEKHIAELKLNECENFINKLSKEYENKCTELKSLRDCENHIKTELNKERNERKSLTTQHEKDVIVINDLQRQVKEMEMILRRKHPDSVSALIVASKSSTVEDNKKKLLEERIARLEQELKDKENHFQSILVTFQEKFSDMKHKYETHIIDVERQLMEDRKVNTDLKNKVNKTNLKDSSVQTVAVSHRHTVGTQTFAKPDRASSAVSRISQNSTLFLNKLKEDSYLVATIKGLQAELTVKQRTISKINRETEELKKNLRNLQKEKEVLANLHPQKRMPCKQIKSVENILAKVTNEFEAELSEARKQKEVLVQEKSNLLDSLKRTNEEFILLKKKRIQDLHTLQLAHEKELMQMNMQLYPLQEEIKLLNRTVEVLQERVRATDEKLRCNGKRHIDVRAGGDNLTTNNKR